MNLGSYRLLVHLGPAHPGDWYQAQDERDDRLARLLVCWNEAAHHDRGPCQAMARRLRLLAQLRHEAVIPLFQLALDHVSQHRVVEALAKRVIEMDVEPLIDRVDLLPA